MRGGRWRSGGGWFVGRCDLMAYKELVDGLRGCQVERGIEWRVIRILQQGG